MQRLHERDLCGYLIESEGHKWHVLSLPAIKEDKTALWPFKHTVEELRTMEARNPIVFERQYMQKPMPLAGRLYKSFKTYSVLPNDCGIYKAVIDTADTGKDNLCSIVYAPCAYGYYIIDVYYTTEGMEVTEQQTANQLTRYSVREVKIESNNGGRGFARNVERECRNLGNMSTSVTWFHQSKNKQARIITNAAEIQNMVYFPADWDVRWPAFARHVKSYMANGKNENDDAEDALTMIVENEVSAGYEIDYV
jgi:predicted phage terminase large subunit-like protein